MKTHLIPKLILFHFKHLLEILHDSLSLPLLQCSIALPFSRLSFVPPSSFLHNTFVITSSLVCRHVSSALFTQSKMIPFFLLLTHFLPLFGTSNVSYFLPFPSLSSTSFPCPNTTQSHLRFPSPSLLLMSPCLTLVRWH